MLCNENSVNNVQCYASLGSPTLKCLIAGGVGISGGVGIVWKNQLTGGQN